MTGHGARWVQAHSDLHRPSETILDTVGLSHDPSGDRGDGAIGSRATDRGDAQRLRRALRSPVDPAVTIRSSVNRSGGATGKADGALRGDPATSRPSPIAASSRCWSCEPLHACGHGSSWECASTARSTETGKWAEVLRLYGPPCSPSGRRSSTLLARRLRAEADDWVCLEELNRGPGAHDRLCDRLGFERLDDDAARCSPEIQRTGAPMPSAARSR